MSAFGEAIPNAGDGDRHGCRGGDGINDDDDDDDDDDDAGKPATDEDGKKGHTKYGFGKDIGKAKQVVLHQFSKAKKQLHNRRHKRALRISSGSGASIVSRASSKTIRGGSGAGCYFCFSRPQVVESPTGSPSSDPNAPSFTYVMLKTLIEKNDFYSRECNPHVD